MISEQTGDPSADDQGARLGSAALVMEELLRAGATSRAELARTTGLSKQTISEVIRVLENEGWVHQNGAVRGGVGRAALSYTIRPQAAFVIGIDLGGTKVHVALADLCGVIVAEKVEPTQGGGRATVAQIVRITDGLIEEAGVARRLVRAAVMGSPGVIDPHTGAISIAPNIPGLDSFDVRGALAEALGVDVTIENDVNLAAVGEHWRGHSRGERNFVFVAAGTGIGMGIFANGHLVRGATGAAGEIAYLPLGGDPFDARGHSLGTLESAIGSAAIAGRYAGLGGAPGLTVRELFEQFTTDERARIALDECARTIAIALAAVHAVLDPKVIILGGSIGSRPELRERIVAYLARCLRRPVQVNISALGSGATLVGAIGTAIDLTHRALFGVGGEISPLALPVFSADAP